MDNNLGKLEILKPRDIWANEEFDFTPWLSENIELLSNLIKFPIEILQLEKKVGSFELDIYGKITGSDQIVIIENQLEVTDHKHLGQLITYASGLDASIIIWVSPTISEEHKSAIGWLNEISNDKINFFLVRVEVIKIDESLPAVRLYLEESPSNYERMLKNIVAGKDGPRHELRRIFWRRFLDYLSTNGKTFASHRIETTDNWMSFPVGNSNYSITATMTINSQIRIELQFGYKERERNKNDFDVFLSFEDEIKDILTEKVSWERLDENIGSRIAVYRNYDKNLLDDDIYRTELYNWMMISIEKFKKVYLKFNKHIR
ncbi:DUF4268 domain-containing protein [Fusibacter ferrireducens]|uniref:DUF4268 domain-containing protein n=1 Tax=Fusibacter ferrireducens TaxID=2785058 RepID=A0ABS0A1L6_9FIRM|nr:DUF4268 domain-containing protein [Fusibacter ferrireducens]MBF4696045.1 DUF4268 domain-containing protein [Fusibacter ferrireducens]